MEENQTPEPPSLAIPAPDFQNEDDVLLYTLKVRQQFVDHHTAAGLPDSKEFSDVVLKALDGIDKIVLSKKKIKSDEKISKDSNAAKLRAAELLRQMANVDFNTNQVGSIPELPDNLEEPEMVDEEMTVGVLSETYEDFTKRVMGDE